MNRFIFAMTAAFAVGALAAPAAGQGAPPGAGSSAVSNSGAVPIGNHMGQNNMTQEQFNQLVDYADQSKRLTKEDKAKGKTLADLQAEDKANAVALVKSLQFTCEVQDAILAAEGPVTASGKKVDTKTFEVACASGLGFFLVSQDPEKPYGFSCFAADATRAADAAAGKPAPAVCHLPANADVKAMASTVLSRAGTNCPARDLRWVGQSSAANTEFVEVACTDGAGYIVSFANPGSAAPVRAVTCHDSALKGLPCKLSSNGNVPTVTLQTFKDALAQHKIACDAANVRVIGQQTASKRYVVEFQCPQQPKGLVAFIPLSDSTAPFETLDCAAAAKKGAVCKLTGK